MEQVNFGYSLKNIPTPESKVYLKMLINSSEKVIRSIRWRVFHYLNPNKSNKKETFGFTSTKPAPSHPDLKDFENGIADIIKNVKFKKETNEFQKKLKKDVLDIKSESKVFIAADKTNNYYKTEAEDYTKLLEKNITKDYKKSDNITVNKVQAEDVKITSKLGIDDRVFETKKRQAFITVKDHKPNFRNNVQTRLLNPTKSEIGKVSKNILDGKIPTIRRKTGLNQWKNTGSARDWYIQLKQKHKLTFIQFDVDGMYPNITEELLDEAIEWAKEFVPISDEEKDIIFQAKRSNIYHEDKPWQKKGEKHFDTTMGSNDGAETCDLVGLYLLSQLQDLGIDIGIYRDDGLAVCKFSPKRTEEIKKKICKIFKKNKLEITIVANFKVVDFLDLTLDLNLGTYSPFLKPNHKPEYIHIQSNHPQNVKRNIAKEVNKRLSENSSNKVIFNAAAPIYQESLKKSGYNYELK